MQTAIKREIKNICDRYFAKAAAMEKTAREHRVRFEKRTGVEAQVSKAPVVPYPDRHFDPRYCKRNANFLSKPSGTRFKRANTNLAQRSIFKFKSLAEGNAT